MNKFIKFPRIYVYRHKMSGKLNHYYFRNHINHNWISNVLSWNYVCILFTDMVAYKRSQLEFISMAQYLLNVISGTNVQTLWLIKFQWMKFVPEFLLNLIAVPKSFAQHQQHIDCSQMHAPTSAIVLVKRLFALAWAFETDAEESL